MVYPHKLLLDLVCSSITITFVGSPYVAQILPKGRCELCCPITENDVSFHIYTKNGYKEEYNIYENPWQASLLANGRTNIIYIHGFSEQYSGPGSRLIKNAYMKRDLENVILVDWNKLSAIPWYVHAISNTEHVAKLVAKFIDDMVYNGIPLYKFHVIGFSLGAEIAGLVGQLVQSGKLMRITGLDPALPLYAGKGSQSVLSKDDALFVDVIHTDGGVLGFRTPMGHADFYPNGGRPAQPGCSVEDFTRTGDLKEFVACSHNRAWKYYADTIISPYDFPAAPCKSFDMFLEGRCPINPSEGIFMGYLVDSRLQGHFFLNTTDHTPYGLGRREFLNNYQNEQIDFNLS